MYTATITEKKILEQHEFILLTVELKSDVPIAVEEKKDKDGKKIKEYVLDNDGNPKLDKEGKPKLQKARKAKYPTKTVYFKFPILTTFADMKVEIKKRIDAIEAAESTDIPMNTPIDFIKK